MIFTLNSSEKEVLEFLQERFALLDDASARTVATNESYLQMRRKGKPRLTTAMRIYEAALNRGPHVTIDEAIATELPDEHLANVDNHKAGYHRHKRRTHKLLHPSRSYNEQDFCDAVLAKQFDIAAAIFASAENVTKEKITSILNQDYRHFRTD